jgi:TonB family protein
MTSRFCAPSIPAWSLLLAGLLLSLTAAAPRLSAQETKPADEPYRVGGEVLAPVKISGAAPVYTELARKARVTGTVIVESVIDEQGNVTNPRVLRGLPLGLDRSAVAAVQTWKFKPATLNGKPVKVYYVLTVRFQVQQEPPVPPQLKRFLQENAEFSAYLEDKRYPEAAALLDRRAAELPADPGLATAHCYLLLKQDKLDAAWAEAESHSGPEAYEALYLVGAYAYERTLLDKVLSPESRAAFVELGLRAETRAMAARGVAFEAPYYKALLLREKAKLTLNPAHRDALKREADQLRLQAQDLLAKAKAAAGGGHPG